MIDDGGALAGTPHFPWWKKLLGFKEPWLKRMSMVPASYEHDLLRTRVTLHVSKMPIECVREMNQVFEKHHNIKPLKLNYLPYVGD